MREAAMDRIWLKSYPAGVPAQVDLTGGVPLFGENVRFAPVVIVAAALTGACAIVRGSATSFQISIAARLF
jgi:hypothetical protein